MSTISLELTSGSENGEGAEADVCEDIEGTLMQDETELPGSELTGRTVEGWWAREWLSVERGTSLKSPEDGDISRSLKVLH